MQFVKIQIPDREERANGIAEISLRGRIICLPDNVFVVPEPALEVLRGMSVRFSELGRGGFDYAEKTLRDSTSSSAQRRATG